MLASIRRRNERNKLHKVAAWARPSHSLFSIAGDYTRPERRGQMAGRVTPSAALLLAGAKQRRLSRRTPRVDALAAGSDVELVHSSGDRYYKCVAVAWGGARRQAPQALARPVASFGGHPVSPARHSILCPASADSGPTRIARLPKPKPVCLARRFIGRSPRVGHRDNKYDGIVTASGSRRARGRRKACLCAELRAPAGAKAIWIGTCARQQSGMGSAAHTGITSRTRPTP
ncbi:hypothetical protein FA95DRAFT_532074 [Auriscalpium vulgare]|uniref:Uncharacterized protein n=1 Tax=Auriscalpium vulgare TaxID=40419 RepID=A0ACB8RFW7_9AGAM|nr:hypothetical protein FA95DRAFT_532074 [Auriscalpium vulgare]